MFAFEALEYVNSWHTGHKVTYLAMDVDQATKKCLLEHREKDQTAFEGPTLQIIYPKGDDLRRCFVLLDMPMPAYSVSITSWGTRLSGKFGVTGEIHATMTERELAIHIANAQKNGFNPIVISKDGRQNAVNEIVRSAKEKNRVPGQTQES